MSYFLDHTPAQVELNKSVWTLSWNRDHWNQQPQGRGALLQSRQRRWRHTLQVHYTILPVKSTYLWFDGSTIRAAGALVYCDEVVLSLPPV